MNDLPPLQTYLQQLLQWHGENHAHRDRPGWRQADLYDRVGDLLFRVHARHNLMVRETGPAGEEPEDRKKREEQRRTIAAHLKRLGNPGPPTEDECIALLNEIDTPIVDQVYEETAD